jgi:hypothetical protein
MRADALMASSVVPGETRVFMTICYNITSLESSNRVFVRERHLTVC